MPHAPHRRSRLLAVAALLLATGAGAVAAAPASSAVVAPRADYQLQGSLVSSVGSPPALTDVAPGNTYRRTTVRGTTNRTVLDYPKGSGLRRAGALSSLTASAYTVVLLWKPQLVDGNYHRLVDLTDGVVETGLYELGGRLSAYPNAVAQGVTLRSSAFSQVVLTRTAGGLVSVYVDGVRQVQFTDSSQSWRATNVARFGKDNSSEETGGQFARIRLYDTALSAADVQALDLLPGGDADLGVTYVDAPDPVLHGGLLGYTATVRSNGPGTARGARVSLTVPAGATFVGSSPSRGTCAAPAAGAVSCTLGDLPVGQQAAVLLVLRAPTPLGSTSSRATVSSTSGDTTAANDTVSQGTTVR